MKSSGFYRSMARGAVRIAAGVMAALTMATTGHAQQSLGAFEFDAKTGTKSVGRMVFDPPAPTGYTPVILEISNGTDRDRTWRPHFSSASGFRQTSACESSFDVEVKAGTSNTVTP